MIVKISGKLVEKKEQSLVVNVRGLYYEIMTSTSVLQRIEETADEHGNVHLVTYHYIQISPSNGMPVMIGFINEIERDFFIKFIKVSGIGPRAAVKALDKPICDITRAIDDGDIKFLTTLPGIGMQRAKEIVAKLQGKIGKFGLIQDKRQADGQRQVALVWQEEAREILMQLQYRKGEADGMIQKALQRTENIHSAEELLNEIYKQKIKPVSGDA